MNSVRTVRPEQLSLEAKTIARTLVRGAAPKGVLVGALLGDEAWDVRPIVMEGGQMVLVRPLPSAMARAPREVLRRLFTQRADIDSSVPHTMGDIDGITWTKRPFIQDLWESVRPPDLRALLGVLATTLSKEKLVHGHLSPANLGSKDGAVVVLDWGVRVTSGVLSPDDWMAPESRRGGNITSASDVYSLGRLLAWENGGSARREDLSLVESMLSQKPEDRPSMENVAHQLSGRAWRPSQPSKLVVPGAPESTEQSNPVRKDVGSLGFWIMLVAAFVAMTVWLQGDWGTERRGEGFPRSYWESSQPSLMEEVVREALDYPRSEAALVIVGDALTGTNRRGIRAALLRIAFNGLWEKSLTDEDRRAAIAIACRSLIGDDTVSVKNPAIALAVLADSPVGQRLPQNLSMLPPERLADLPLPFGASFRSLFHLVNASYESREVKALAHILVGDVNEDTLGAFVGSPEVRPEYARLILTLAEIVPGLDLPLATLLSRDTRFREEFVWFNESEAVSWDDVPIRRRVRVVLGDIQEKVYSIELLADLLSYPRTEIRAKALAALQREYLKNENRLLAETIAQSADTINRRDIVTIISASYMKGDEAYALIDSWLSSEPDTTLVAAILLERKDVPPLDPLSVELARYLSKREVVLSVDEWALLSLHKEPLARALAYSRLDPKDPEQRKVLEQMSQVEPGKRLRSQILDKLRPPEE